MRIVGHHQHVLFRTCNGSLLLLEHYSQGSRWDRGSYNFNREIVLRFPVHLLGAFSFHNRATICKARFRRVDSGRGSYLQSVQLWCANLPGVAIHRLCTIEAEME